MSKKESITKNNPRGASIRATDASFTIPARSAPSPTPELPPKVAPIILPPQALPKVNMNEENIHAVGRKEFISQEEADSWANPNERKPGKHFKTWGARLLKRWNDLDLGEKDRSENLRECGLLCHDLEQYDPKATRLPTKEELEEDEKRSGKNTQVSEEDPEAGPGPSTQANREGLPSFPQIKDQEDEEEFDIVFVEKKRNSARQHPNLNPMSVWEGKVPSSNNPAYAFNKQQDNLAEYADTSYMLQLMGIAREAITDVF